MNRIVQEELYDEYSRYLARSGSRRVFHVMKSFNDKTPKTVMVMNRSRPVQQKRSSSPKTKGLVLVVDSFEYPSRILKVLDPNEVLKSPYIIK